MRNWQRLALAAGAACATGAWGDEITRFDFDGAVVGGRNLAFSTNPDLSLTPADPGTWPNSDFDVWGVVDRNVNSDFADDSLIDPLDTFGVARSAETGFFFGIEDLDNPDNPSASASATWVFDIAGFTDVRVSVDAAAMGNFELGMCPLIPCIRDSYDLFASIDGGPEVPVLVSDVLESLPASYTLESGVIITLNDPLTLGGVTLTNRFQTITSPVLGAGGVLTLTLRGQGDSGEEIVLLDNLVVSGTPAAGCDPDVNQDGNVDQDDVAYLVGVVAGADNPTGIDPDFNRDGNVDQADVASLVDVVAGGACP